MNDNYTIQPEVNKLNKELSKFFETVDSKEVPKYLKSLGFKLVSKVIRRNPVDTGRSRAGWFVAAEKLGILTSIESKKEGSYKEKLKGTNKYIEITNRVNYILFLEYGTRKNQAYSMVRTSLKEISQLVK